MGNLRSIIVSLSEEIYEDKFHKDRTQNVEGACKKIVSITCYLLFYTFHFQPKMLTLNLRLFKVAICLSLYFKFLFEIIQRGKTSVLRGMFSWKSICALEKLLLTFTTLLGNLICPIVQDYATFLKFICSSTRKFNAFFFLIGSPGKLDLQMEIKNI